MNFKLCRYLIITITLLIGVFFCIGGLMSMILPWSSHLQAAITQLILENSWTLTIFGAFCILAGISIVIYALRQTRDRYVEIQTGNLSITLDEKIIHQYLEAYWKKRFPSAKIPFTLNLRRRSLEIIVDFPDIPHLEQKRLLEQVKDDFNDLFGRVLGYPYDVHLIANGSIPN